MVRLLTPRSFADLLTTLRATIALGLPWLGFTQGASAFPLTVYLMLIVWISDFFDGTLARRVAKKTNSWLGEHDLHVDITASAGLLIYLVISGFVLVSLAFLYILTWFIFFLRFGVSKSTGSLVQAPIYAWFLWLASRLAPQAATWVLIWVVVNLLFTWRRFVYQVIPEFLDGMSVVLRSK